MKRTQLNINMQEDEKRKLDLYSKEIKGKGASLYVKDLIASDSGIEFVDKRKRNA